MNDKKWELVPGKSVGPLTFGMDRKSVRKALGEKYKSFKKSMFSKSFSDAYASYHTYYSKENTLEAIEFFDGVEITLGGKTIFPGKLSSLKSVIDDLEETNGSFISKNLSIGAYVEEDEVIESFLVGCDGYYKGE